jgi:hypothetical protein
LNAVTVLAEKNGYTRIQNENLLSCQDQLEFIAYVIIPVAMVNSGWHVGYVVDHRIQYSI